MAKTRPKPDPTKRIPPLYEMVSRELIEKISANIGKPFPPSAIGNLDSLLRQYMIDKQFVDGRSAWGEVEAALNLVEEHARMLSNTLKDLDFISRGEIHSSAMDHGEDCITVYPRIERLQQEAEKIAGWTKQALKKVSPRKKKGRRDKFALPRLVTGLVGLYEETTGLEARGAYWNNYEKDHWCGDFIEFCKIIINEKGLRDIIKKVLSPNAHHSSSIDH